MPIDPDFLELLRCPVTRQRLAPAPPALLAALEERRRQGRLRLPAAAPQWNPAEPLEAVLVREDGRVGYPVQGGIPILLPSHGFELEGRPGAASEPPSSCPPGSPSSSRLQFPSV